MQIPPVLKGALLGETPTLFAARTKTRADISLTESYWVWILSATFKSPNVVARSILADR
jgi:hypothetical protein